VQDLGAESTAQADSLMIIRSITITIGPAMLSEEMHRSLTLQHDEDVMQLPTLSPRRLERVP
jgi:hypothetical protein